MALATREVELIIIAQDGASSTLARIGGAVTLLGAGMTKLGIDGLQSLRDMTMEAAELRQQLALAYTQLELPPGNNVALEDLIELVKSVGRDLPVPFEELNESLFDIFSTLTLNNIDEAELLLRKFAESAVAGQAPVKDIGRAIIAWLNALDMEPTVDNVNRLLGIQFELVRKGAGTYTEFAGEVGKAIPAFVAANQPVEEFGGILAFLTRNGLSAAMATTSAARAAELMFTPKAIKNLRGMGIEVTDSTGGFVRMSDILRDLQPIFADMDDAQRKIKFKEIFGTGRIQARRFFDLALPNFDELIFLINEMEDAGPGLQRAYDIMLEQPLSQLDLLKNRWAALRMEIGDVFIPTITSKLLPIIDKVLTWWENLDDEMKENIATWASWAAAGLVAAGVLTTILGSILLIVGLLKAFNITLGAIALGFGKFFLIGAAIAAVAWLIWKNWDDVWELLQKMGGWLGSAWDFLEPYIQRIVDTFMDQWEETKKWWADLVEEYGPVALEVWESIVDWWEEDGFPTLKKVWEKLQETWEKLWTFLEEVVNTAFEIIRGIIEGAVIALTWIWDNWGADLIEIWNNVWTIIGGILEGAFMILGGLFTLLTGLLTGDWEMMKEGLIEIWDGLWLTVASILEGAWGIITTIAVAFGDWFMGWWGPLWETVSNWVEGVWDNIYAFFEDIFADIADLFRLVWESDIVVFFRNIWGIMYEVVRITVLAIVAIIIEWFTRAWEQIVAIWTGVWTFLGFIWNAIWEIGKVIWEGLSNSILAPLRWVYQWIVENWAEIKTYLGVIWFGIKTVAGIVWEGIKTVILGPVFAAWQGIKDVAEWIVGKLAWLWEKAQEWAEKIRDALSMINPLEWFSPPLTAQVHKGMAALTKEVIDPLKMLDRNLQAMMPGIRDQLNMSNVGPGSIGVTGPVTQNRFTVPVTVVLDGEVIAEHTMELTGLNEFEELARTS